MRGEEELRELSAPGVSVEGSGFHNFGGNNPGFKLNTAGTQGGDLLPKLLALEPEGGNFAMRRFYGAGGGGLDPLVELGCVGQHGFGIAFIRATDGQAESLFPALHRTYTFTEIGGDFLP